MTGNHDPHFRVAWLSKVERQVRGLVERATSQGAYAEAAALFRSLTRRLRNSPLDLGEPQYHTHLPGGVVVQAVVQGLAVRFAVYEKDHTVLVLDVTPLSGHPWDEGNP